MAKTTKNIVNLRTFFWNTLYHISALTILCCLSNWAGDTTPILKLIIYLHFLVVYWLAQVHWRHTNICSSCVKRTRKQDNPYWDVEVRSVRLELTPDEPFLLPSTAILITGLEFICWCWYLTNSNHLKIMFIFLNLYMCANCNTNGRERMGRC